MHQSATPSFRSPREEEFHYREEEWRVASELRVAEARVEVVDNDTWLAILVGASGDFASGVGFEKFGDLVS